VNRFEFCILLSVIVNSTSAVITDKATAFRAVRGIG